MPDHLLLTQLAAQGELLPLEIYVDRPADRDDFYPGCFEWQRPLGEWLWAPLFMMSSYCFYDVEHLATLDVEPLPIHADLEVLATYHEHLTASICMRNLDLAAGWSTIGYAGSLMRSGINLLPEDNQLDISAAAQERWCWCLTQLRRMREISTDLLTGRGSRPAFYDGRAVLLLDHSLNDALASARPLMARPMIAADRHFGACGLVIRRRIPNPVAAGHLLSWLQSPEAQRIIARVGGRVPVRRSVFLATPPELPGGLTARDLSPLLDGQPCHVAINPAHVRLVREVIDLEVQRFLMLELPLRQTVANLLRKANAFLASVSTHTPNLEVCP